jgi:predicted nucleic acid-binding protein
MDEEQMARPKIYIETSVISYLTARPSRDVVVLAHQQLTRDWWENRRSEFEVFASAIVALEAERGDPAAARARIDLLANIPRLSASQAAEGLVPILLRETGLPTKAYADMAHVALAAVHGMQYLLTWNCRHIANAMILRTVVRSCRQLGYEPPVVCTPEELMGY